MNIQSLATAHAALREKARALFDKEMGVAGTELLIRAFFITWAASQSLSGDDYKSFLKLADMGEADELEDMRRVRMVLECCDGGERGFSA